MTALFIAVYSFCNHKIAPISGVRVNNMHNTVYYSANLQFETIFIK